MMFDAVSHPKWMASFVEIVCLDTLGGSSEPFKIHTLNMNAFFIILYMKKHDKIILYTAILVVIIPSDV